MYTLRNFLFPNIRMFLSQKVLNSDVADFQGVFCLSDHAMFLNFARGSIRTMKINNQRIALDALKTRRNKEVVADKTQCGNRL